MESTDRRLNEVHCRPTGDDIETVCRALGLKGQLSVQANTIFYVTNGQWSAVQKKPGAFTGREEIPVSHFLDLLHDRITPWRLEEDGFDTIGGVVYRKQFMLKGDDGGIRRIITVITDTGRVYLNDGPTNVTTYTQLLTLIELIG